MSSQAKLILPKWKVISLCASVPSPWGLGANLDLVQFGYSILFSIFFGTVRELTTSDELRIIYSLFDNDSFLYAGFNSNTFFSFLNYLNVQVMRLGNVPDYKIETLYIFLMLWLSFVSLLYILALLYMPLYWLNLRRY